MENIRFPKSEEHSAPLTSRELRDQKESLRAAVKLKRDANVYEREENPAVSLN